MLFDWQNGNTDLKKEHINGKGIPVVSSGVENTGIIGCTDVDARILPAHTITVDMFGNVYYRDFEYKEVTHARVFTLIPKGFELDVQTGLYFVSSLKVLSKIYSYDNMCSYAKISNMDISLPVIENSNPNHEYTVDDIDWQYMRDRITELERARITELDAYLQATGLNDYELTEDDKKVLSLSAKRASDEDGTLEDNSEDEVRFGKIKVSKLFDIHPTSAYKMSNSDLFDTIGDTPVLSNSSANNGIGGFSGLKKKKKGGIITFSDTTTGGDTMFYQADAFIGYPHVQGMYPFIADKWDEKCSLYAISTIRKAAGDGWNYAVKFNRALVKELMIELPVIENPNPNHEYTVDDIDWQYMRDRITELERDRITELERDRITELDAYLQATGLNNYELTEDDVRYGKFVIGEIFNSQNGDNNLRKADVRYGKFVIGEIFNSQNGDNNLRKADVNGKGVHIVTAGVKNNGILGLSDKRAKVINANTITVDMFGNAYFRDFNYKMTCSVFSLELKEGALSEGAGLYICSELKQLAELFDYDNSCSFNKIKSLSIELPIKSDGTPDFEYMERYIRVIEKVVISDVMKYKDKVIETTKRVVGG